MSETKYEEVARAEMHPDVYGGPNSDQITPMWEGHWDGDMESFHDRSPINLPPEKFPPGTRVIVQMPLCPECELNCELCSCGFDWKAWAKEQYS